MRQGAARWRQHGRHLFEEVQRHARITAGKLGDGGEHAVLGREMLCAETALRIAQSLLQDADNLPVREFLQPHDAQA